MKENPFSQGLMRLATGSGRLLKGVAIFILAAVLAASGGIVIVYPLWFFASNYPNLYSVFLLAVIAAAILYTITRRVVVKAATYGNPGLFFTDAVIPFIKRIALAAIIIISPIILLVLLGYSRIFLVIPGAAAYLLFIGYIVLVRKHPGRDTPDR